MPVPAVMPPAAVKLLLDAPPTEPSDIKRLRLPAAVPKLLILVPKLEPVLVETWAEVIVYCWLLREMVAVVVGVVKAAKVPLVLFS